MRSQSSTSLNRFGGDAHLFPQSAEGQYALDYGFAFGTGNYLGDIAMHWNVENFSLICLSQTKLSTHFCETTLEWCFGIARAIGNHLQ